MTDTKKFSATRRTLFLGGGAAMGTLATAAVGATALLDDSLPLRDQLKHQQHELIGLRNVDAILKLQQNFAGLLHRQAYTELAGLFAPSAGVDIAGYRAMGVPDQVWGFVCNGPSATKASALHTGLRPGTSGEQDWIEISNDGSSARAGFYCQAQISIPLTGDYAMEEMARQSGQHARRSWQDGMYELAFTKLNGAWQIAGVTFTSTELS